MVGVRGLAGTGAPSRRRQFVVGSALGGLTSLFFLLWMVLAIGGTRTTSAVDDLGELAAALVAALLCGLAASRSLDRGKCWALLAASSLSWAAGEAVWSYDDLIRNVPVPFPSLADIGFAAAIPLMFAGLLLFPGYPQRTARRVQGLLDGCVIATSLLFASWATILGPIYRSHQGGVLKQVLSLTYPASDVVMLSLVMILIARAGRHRRTAFGLVMTGVVAFAVADSSFAYLTEVNNYGNGTFLDTGWVAGYLLIGLGALWQLTSPAPEAVRSDESTVSLMAPYVPVLIVLVVTAVALLRGKQVDTVAWIMALALVVLVLGREAVRLWDQAVVARSRGPAPDAAIVGR